MTRAAAVAALQGESAGFIAGASWVPPDTLGGLVRSLGLDFAFVPADQTGSVLAVAELHGLDAAAIWAVPGVLGRVAESLGWSEALRLSAGGPGSLAEALAEALLDALASAREGIGGGADIVLVADDLAGATGPLVSPDFAVGALLPYYREIAAEALGRGVLVAFHSDGDVRALMPALAEAGYSAVHIAGAPADAVEASVAAAQAAGLVAIGGIVAAGLGVDPRAAGRNAGRLARERGLLVCDDGGLVTAEDLAAYASAVGAARKAFLR